MLILIKPKDKNLRKCCEPWQQLVAQFNWRKNYFKLLLFNSLDHWRLTSGWRLELRATGAPAGVSLSTLRCCATYWDCAVIVNRVSYLCWSSNCSSLAWPLGFLGLWVRVSHHSTKEWLRTAGQGPVRGKASCWTLRSYQLRCCLCCQPRPFWGWRLPVPSLWHGSEHCKNLDWGISTWHEHCDWRWCHYSDAGRSCLPRQQYLDFWLAAELLAYWWHWGSLSGRSNSMTWCQCGEECCCKEGKSDDDW